MEDSSEHAGDDGLQAWERHSTFSIVLCWNMSQMRSFTKTFLGQILCSLHRMSMNVSCCLFAAQTCQVGHTGWIYRLVILSKAASSTLTGSKEDLDEGSWWTMDSDGLGWTRMDSDETVRDEWKSDEKAKGDGDETNEKQMKKQWQQWGNNGQDGELIKAHGKPRRKETQKSRGDEILQSTSLPLGIQHEGQQSKALRKLERLCQMKIQSRSPV